MNWNIFKNKVPESWNFHVTPNPNLNLNGTLSGLMLKTLGGRDAGHVRTGVSHPTQIGFSHNSVKNSPRFPFKSLLTKFFMPFNFETTGSHNLFSGFY